MKTNAQGARRDKRGFPRSGVTGLVEAVNGRQLGVSPQESAGSPPLAGGTIAIDPVCGMPVERERSISLERDGRLVFFCSRGCRDEFLGVRTMDEQGRAEELVRRVLDEPALLHSAFQPILSLETGRLVGYEGLARFAPVPLQLPEAWFDLAARAGLTPDLEALALRTSLAVVDQRRRRLAPSSHSM